MSTLVKICGITQAETIHALRQLPVDYVGFVFAPSKRQVDAEQAAALIRELEPDGGSQSGPRTVGVFVDPTHDELTAVLRTAQLDVVQLHGREAPAFCREVRDAYGVQVFKVLPVAQQHDAAASSALPMPEDYTGAIDGLMLDTYDARVAGGTGVTFRWDVIPTYREWAEQNSIPLLIAGGLHVDNVSDLIANYRPHGVDVSSGVETGGKKDNVKITAFVERVKRRVNNDA